MSEAGLTRDEREAAWTHTPGASGGRGDSEFVDHCIDCSEAAKEWVPWPCSAAALVKAAVEQDRYVRSMDEAAREQAAYERGAADVRAALAAAAEDEAVVRAVAKFLHDRVMPGQPHPPDDPKSEWPCRTWSQAALAAFVEAVSAR